MDATERIEHALAAAIGGCSPGQCPPKLAEAIRYAVFPGGARIRPHLCLTVAQACGEVSSAAVGAAASIELIHCASLVHDDLPCFDDADIRRGKPSVHKAYGEPIAVLVGDALIVLAFDQMARSAAVVPERLPALTLALARAVGAQGGLIAGQAWEEESSPDIDAYQSAKTGSLFAAAAAVGAVAAGADPMPWRKVGEMIGLAYQVADDLADAGGERADIGKPTGQDTTLGRPNAVAALGERGALQKLERLTSAAIEAVPACPGREELVQVLTHSSRRLVPKRLATAA